VKEWALADDIPLREGMVARSTRFPDEEILLPTEMLEVWRRPLFSWRDKQLMPFAITQPTRATIRIRRSTQTREQTWRKEGNNWVQSGVSAEPSSAPHQKSARSNAVVDVLLAASNLRAVEARLLPPDYLRPVPWLDLSIGLPSGERRLELWRESERSTRWLALVSGASSPEAEVQDDARTLWVVEDEAVKLFEPGLNTLFPRAKPAGKP